MYYQQQGYSLEQITQNINYYQTQLMSMPPQARNFQEHQAMQSCKAELQKWTELYQQAVQQQQYRQQQMQYPQYNQPSYQQPIQPTMGNFGSPIQPFQNQPMMPTTTASNSNNVTGRYSSKKSVQESMIQKQQMNNPVIDIKPITTATPPVVEKEVEFYISEDDSKFKEDRIMIELPNETRSIEDIKKVIKKLYDDRTIPDKKDLIRVQLDRLLTDLFNVLAKNFLSKSLTVDSFMSDYSSIEEYMDKLELVKDQKELDKVLDYIFKLLEKANISKEGDNNYFIDVPMYYLDVQSYDTFKNIKEVMLGKSEVILNESMSEDLKSLLPKEEGLSVTILEVTQGVFTNSYYLVRSNKKLSLHVV